MQFKHPELLWALLLLLIPIIVHLFQLRRFKKTAFTNVAMLQKVVAESRKSSAIKKWLLLLSRLALLTCLVLAFAQPFFANKNALKEKETVIYLDNSFSMQSKQDGLSLLDKSIQDILKTVPPTSELTLFTNDETFRETTLSAIQNSLLSLQHTEKQLSFNEIVFKAKNFFNNDDSSIKNTIIISDFQNRIGSLTETDFEELNIHLVQLEAEQSPNISIDSVYLGNTQNNQADLHVVVSGLKNEESLPISLFNGDRLIAKTAIVSSGKLKSEVIFSIPERERIKGRIVINDNDLSYDNQFYFNVNEQEKIKILSINQTDADFLSRIFTQSEFEFLSFDLNELDYSQIETQNLIILNGLEEIPTNLQTILESFEQNGGNLVIIPAANSDLASYNTFLTGFNSLQLQERIVLELNISAIAFEHPLYKNVFEKKVTNFEYPSVKNFYKSNKKATSAISFANGEPFLLNTGNLFVFTSALEKENSNFIASPLIVPTFYNMGLLSLKKSELYLSMNTQNQIDIAATLEKDNIVRLIKDDAEFIPRQQSFANKLSLAFDDNPNEDGTYVVITKTDTLGLISFNYPREESNLTYQDASQMEAASFQNTVPKLFAELAEDNSIYNYWKWFVIFALVFALVELLIQKFLA
ncbi:BatA domain-containing protein [Croceitalea rosinachiae]|uniref:BatA domain-containing protein n=1 Tax=Croceitalea rosinachiae TaxID=3075596 RepID=A0ABU3ABR2_9FLAO|nr:BatA domain-containing protein [Croceitalea sp. F388]MDT0607424.1 BatA domain-containing protein [Croceitalea sp. F388]